MFDKFLIARGGPFFQLQKQLRLLHEDSYRAGSRAILFVTIAWGGPLILSAISGDAWGPFSTHPYLSSLTPWARFFVAVGLFVVMERFVEERLRTLLAHFERAPLITQESLPLATNFVAKALKQRDSILAEIVCGTIALVVSIPLRGMLLSNEVSTWAVHVTPENNALTAAGWWCLIISNPLFVFLVLRWLWRLYLWSNLLRCFAKLDIRLVSSHPDGRGGLAFIGRYPNVFTIFVFALSCVLGAALAQEMLDKGISATTFGCVMGGWLALVLGGLSYALFAFQQPLSELRTQTLIAASAPATEHFRSREREILGRNIVLNQDDDTAAKTIADPTALYTSANKLSTNLISRSTLLPISAAALLPLAAAGATQLPATEVKAVG